METIRLTTAQAIVRFLVAQRTEIDGHEAPLFPGVFAIFGHGNVTCLGEALNTVRDQLPTWRGQNEQTMAMAAVAYAKAARRRQIMVATSSIGPGALNMVTAAGIAHANRLPLLMFSGDAFAGRVSDPVLQQVEHFHDPTITVNDAFRAVTRYWDRIVRPEQVVHALPHAVATMLDPATCGPAFIGLPQDVQALAYDFPESFFEPRVHRIRRPGPDEAELTSAADAVRGARRPLVIAGGGVHYAEAETMLAAFAERHGLPVAETVAGKSSLTWDHPSFVGPIGVTGGSAANALAAEADLVLAVGTRLQDFTTGSWTVFGEHTRLIGLNVATFDATKHLSLPLVADALRGLEALEAALGDHRTSEEWRTRAAAAYRGWNEELDAMTAPPADGAPPSYAAVIRRINDLVRDDDYALAAAGGLPGELNKHWRATGIRTFDCEYGFSCMGYEIGGAWGAAMALPERTVVTFCGDGSYLMANSEIYSSVLSGHPFVMILCDNGGYAVIDRLQVAKGGAHFNNMLEDVRAPGGLVPVDFAAHAAAMGAWTTQVDTLDELAEAFGQAREAGRTAVIVIRTDPHVWTGGDAWWDVGVPEVSSRDEVRAAKAEHEQGRDQRVGV